MRQLLRTIMLLSAFIVVSFTAAQKPNFVVIFTDDQGYADLSCFGGTHVKTPRIDQMADEGAKLTSFYVAAALCTPSRAALMTGSYPKRIDMTGGSKFPVLLAADPKGLNPQETTLAEVLKTAGYKTGMFGKWHLGDQPEFLPTRQGFDEFFGIPYSHDIHPFHPQQEHFQFPSLPLLDDEEVIEMDPDADNLTKRFTERAVQFIDENKDRPFFLYLPHPAPHNPLHASPAFMKDVPESVKAVLDQEDNNIDYKTRTRLFPQVINEIDWSVGRILDALKKNGIDDNTLVIFTSDNGPAVGKATPLRGKKGSTFEGGMREPTVIRWPGKIPAGAVNEELMTVMDLLPTFAKLAGAQIPSCHVIDGKDIWPVLTEDAKSPHEAFFYYKVDKLEAVRSGKWKLFMTITKGKKTASPKLYNLEEDIGETTNVAKDNPKVVERLQARMTNFQKELEQNSRPAAFVDNPKPLTMKKKTVARLPHPALTKPNIVLIMADDLGYECIGANGCEDYKTPVIDKLAAHGVRFEQCFANPICTPSRAKIMTGLYGKRNYVGFGRLDRSQRTFANQLKEVGYVTAIAGKWQLGRELDAPQHFGFDQSCLWQHTRTRVRQGTKIDSRYPNPRMEINGKPVDYNNGEYGPDLSADFICDFIEANQDKPFLVYYPMILTHCPFDATPDSDTWDPKSQGSPEYKGPGGEDPAAYDLHKKNFKDMVQYTDQLVGKIVAKLEKLGLRENTLIIFTGDNGTDEPIKTNWNGELVAGGKGITGNTGTRVPLVINWPGKIAPAVQKKELVEFSDLMPTLCEVAGAPLPKNYPNDGVSLWPVLSGKGERTKDHVYIWFNHITQEKYTWARNLDFGVLLDREKQEYTFQKFPSHFSTNAVQLDSASEMEKAVFSNLKKVIEDMAEVDGIYVEENF